MIEVAARPVLSPYESVLVVPIKSRKDALKALNGYDEKKRYVCEIKEYREKRSLDANAYMWVLCTAISKELSKESPISKEDVYRRAVREGNCYYRQPIPDEGVEHFKRIWSARGIGWFAEFAYKSTTIKGHSTMFAYYGSSEYDTKEMRGLINIIVEEAKALDIETRTPDEINRLISLWDEAVEKDQSHE